MDLDKGLQAPEMNQAKPEEQQTESTRLTSRNARLYSQIKIPSKFTIVPFFVKIMNQMIKPRNTDLLCAKKINCLTFGIISQRKSQPLKHSAATDDTKTKRRDL